MQKTTIGKRWLSKRYLDNQQSSLEEFPQEGIKETPDIFLKKVGAWAYLSHWFSTSNEVQDTPSRFGVNPVDANIMLWLEKEVSPSNKLPTGHRYDITLSQIKREISHCNNLNDLDIEFLEVIDRDVQLRDYLKLRKYEYFNA